jgi:hypothetical protein
MCKYEDARKGLALRLSKAINPIIITPDNIRENANPNQKWVIFLQRSLTGQ